MASSKKTIIQNGTKFNRLTVEYFVGVLKGKRLYRCRCQCGKEKVTSGNKLKSGHVKSCGCARKGCRKGPWPSGFNAVYATYKGGSAAKKFGFGLSKSAVFELVRKNCHYCGCPPANFSLRFGESEGFVYNGMDRVDSLAGYTTENAVPCCWQCNTAKRCLSSGEFLGIVRLIYENNRAIFSASV